MFFAEQRGRLVHLMKAKDSLFRKLTMKVIDETLITIEKYFFDGKVSRVVIKSQRNNYWLDLPINSFWVRSFITAVISMMKAVSTIITDLKIAFVKR